MTILEYTNKFLEWDIKYFLGCISLYFVYFAFYPLSINFGAIISTNVYLKYLSFFLLIVVFAQPLTYNKIIPITITPFILICLFDYIYKNDEFFFNFTNNINNNINGNTDTNININENIHTTVVPINNNNTPIKNNVSINNEINEKLVVNNDTSIEKNNSTINNIDNLIFD